MAIGFPGLHALNMVLGIFYTLAQTLVFSRVLDHRLFSQTVAAAALGLYLLPLNQSVARANFVLLREHHVGRAGTDRRAMHLPEVSAAFYANQAILLIVSLAGPALLGAADSAAYLGLAGFLFYSLFTNIWVTEMQMALIATGRALLFEYVNTGRRILTFGLLVWLLLDGSFLDFALVATGMTVAFHLVGLVFMGGEAGLFSWPRGLTWAATRAHGRRLFVSLQATASEWLTFNGPYAAFMLRFGIGPGLVAIDAVIKLVRVVVTITRNLSEIALPRVTHAVLKGDGRQARGPVLLVLLGAGGGAAVLSAAVLYHSHLVFSLLLGPNNTVPAGAGPPAALAILSSVMFSAGGTLIGHTGRSDLVTRLLIASAVASGLFFLGMALLPVGTLGGFWLFAITLAFASVAATAMLASLVSAPPASRRQPPSLARLLSEEPP